MTDSLSLQCHVVGFFDLLGQQQYLRNLRTLPNSNDPEAIARTREDLENTYAAVVAMRQFFKGTFDIHSRRQAPDCSLTPEQQASFRQMNNIPLQFQGFSDSLVVFQSLRKTEAAKLPVRGVLGMFFAAALTSVRCLALGHPIRGGIDLGVGFELSEREVYGAALARAYKLESRIANYPRIVIGDELVRYLTKIRDQPPTDVFAMESTKIAEACLHLLACDDDGSPFVDYLGPYMRSHFASSYATEIDKAYNRVLEFSDRYKAEKNTQLAFRYTLLRNYFEARIALWADVPREAESNKK